MSLEGELQYRRGYIHGYFSAIEDIKVTKKSQLVKLNLFFWDELWPWRNTDLTRATMPPDYKEYKIKKEKQK